MTDNQKTLKKAGDVIVDSILMKGFSNVILNITPQLISLEINESIFEHYITGMVTISDSEDLSNFFPLIGMETMEIEFHTPSLSDNDSRFAYKKMFFVYKASNKIKVNERNAYYQLYIISYDALLDKMSRISKTFKGEGMAIIEEITKDYLSGDVEVAGDKTSNNLVFISNYWHPSKCIDYICSNSVSEQSNSSSYLFFEDRNGYVFATLPSIFERPYIQEFNLDNYAIQTNPNENSPAVRDITADYKSIVDIKIESEYNYFDRVKNGYYGGELITYDMNTQQYIHKREGYDWEKQSHLNLGKPIPTNLPVSSSSYIVYKPYNTQPFTTDEVPQVNGIDDTNIKYKLARQQHLAQLGTSKLTIKVHGRTDYTVGQIVLVTIPKDKQILKSDEVNFDVLNSGRYIIASIQHVVNHNYHACYMNLMKDSYIASIDHSVYAGSNDRELPNTVPKEPNW